MIQISPSPVPFSLLADPANNLRPLEVAPGAGSVESDPRRLKVKGREYHDKV